LTETNTHIGSEQDLKNNRTKDETRFMTVVNFVLIYECHWLCLSFRHQKLLFCPS